MLLLHSKLWGMVDGSKVAPDASDQVGLTTWKLKDSKTLAHILLYNGEKQLISLQPLATSKEVLDRIKQLYQQLNKALQVNLHKQL